MFIVNLCIPHGYTENFYQPTRVNTPKYFITSGWQYKISINEAQQIVEKHLQKKSLSMSCVFFIFFWNKYFYGMKLSCNKIFKFCLFWSYFFKSKVSNKCLIKDSSHNFLGYERMSFKLILSMKYSNLIITISIRYSSFHQQDSSGNNF